MSRSIESIESSIQALKDILPEGRNVLVAVSGGPDSMALLHALYSHREYLGVKDIAVVHYDHGLRNVSTEEADFVTTYCRSLGIQCYIGQSPKGSLYDSNHGSMQETARIARYQFIESIADSYGADCIAIAHHEDDQIETVLINIFRGTGIDGLCGIPFRRDRYIRPFLHVSRLEIERYCALHQLDPRRDQSNNDPSHYLRNKIRIKLIPELEADYHPGIKDSILRLSHHAEIDTDYLHHMTLKALNDAVISFDDEILMIDIGILISNHRAIQRRLIRLAIERVRGSREGVTEEHVNAVLAFCKEDIQPQSITIPSPAIHITRRGAELIIKQSPPVISTTFDILLEDLPINTTYGLPNEWQLVVKYISEAVPDRTRPSIHDNQFTALIDVGKVNIPQLHIRTWLQGDRIDPLGMDGKTKKVQDLFVNAKLSINKRAVWPVVADNIGVVWVPGIALSERVKVEPNTTRYLEMHLLLPALLNTIDLVEP